MMKKSILALASLFFCGAILLGQTNGGKVDIKFQKMVVASDLSIESLAAESKGDLVEFFLGYTTKEARYLSFFDPPNGYNLSYFDAQGLMPEKKSISFEAPKDQLKKSGNITMRFSRGKDPEGDRNFIFLELPNPLRKTLGIELSPDARVAATPQTATTGGIGPGDDVRERNLSQIKSALSSDLIESLWFNEKVDFGKSDKMAEDILEKGKNPGLGVRSLHARGIDGRGINLAIIDQNLAGEHPEFIGKIRAYKDFGTEQPATAGSMHGPAVMSLLAGNTTGTAPGAGVYFAAIPSWKADAKYLADALDWIIAENKNLLVKDKIRAVSISAAPSGPGSPFTINGALWDRAVERAEAAGILILDCTQNHGFIGPGYYDPKDQENVHAFTAGFPRQKGAVGGDKNLYAPTSFRSSAEEYEAGHPSYQYTGTGGLSWAIPYVAGVLAMGWQVRPEMKSDEIVKILRESAITNAQGAKVINPIAFIQALEKK
jgi:serine protease AprX